MKYNAKITKPLFIVARYLQGEERETVEYKLKILERELKHIIGILTDWVNFVFANPQKKEASAHYTHLQIALANPQTKICKRVQSLKRSSSLIRINSKE